MKFAKGGFVPGYAGGGRPLSGQRIMPSHGTPITRDNGDNRLATVRTGEVILNERQQAALGGADVFRRIGVPGFADGGITDSQTRIAANNAQGAVDINQLATLLNRITPVLVLEDFEAKQSSVNNIQQKAMVL